MINIIIPAYNAHETIEKAIVSIAVQTISDQIEIILVDDGSDKGYEELIKKFEKVIKIKYIKHKINLGISAARQTGLDAVDQPYFGWSDADDYYIENNAFENMLKEIQKNKSVIAASSFIQEKENIIHTNDAWTFAKLYRTSFIKNNKISFPPENGVEDIIFNKTIKLITKTNQEYISFLKKPVYLWKENKTSLTRKNKNEFRYYQMPINLLKGVDHIFLNKNIIKEKFNDLCVNILFVTYLKYYDSKNNAQKKLWYKEILKESIIFFNKYIKSQNINFDQKLINEKIKLIYRDETIKQYQTFHEFLKLIKGE